MNTKRKAKHGIPSLLPGGKPNPAYRKFVAERRRLSGDRAKAKCAECGKIEFGLGWARKGHFLQRRDSQHRCLAKVYVCGECWPEPTECVPYSDAVRRRKWKRENPLRLVPLRRAYKVLAPDTGEAAIQRQLVESLLSSLSDRERAVLVARFLHNRTLESVGDDWGLTRERVRQIENTALFRLRKRLPFLQDKL